MTRRFAPRPAVPSRWLGTLLVAALLWAQALGLAHRSLHGSLPAGGAPALAHPAAAPGAPQLRADALFGHERDGAACRLYDQLALGDLAPLPVVVAAPPPAPCVVVVVPPALPDGAVRTAYRARAPPVRIG